MKRYFHVTLLIILLFPLVSGWNLFCTKAHFLINLNRTLFYLIRSGLWKPCHMFDPCRRSSLKSLWAGPKVLEFIYLLIRSNVSFRTVFECKEFNFFRVFRKVPNIWNLELKFPTVTYQEEPIALIFLCSASKWSNPRLKFVIHTPAPFPNRK